MTNETTTDEACPAKTEDGRACWLKAGHRPRPGSGHSFAPIEGQNCTCMLRWHPNRCTAHPEENQ
jgi:hypothetical protein